MKVMTAITLQVPIAAIFNSFSFESHPSEALTGDTTLYPTNKK